jgi:hypothetical protein
MLKHVVMSLGALTVIFNHQYPCSVFCKDQCKEHI